jgi:hypothetical protein
MTLKCEQKHIKFRNPLRYTIQNSLNFHLVYKDVNITQNYNFIRFHTDVILDSYFKWTTYYEVTREQNAILSSAWRDWGKLQKYISQHSRYLRQDLNPGAPKYRSANHRQRCLVASLSWEQQNVFQDFQLIPLRQGAFCTDLPTLIDLTFTRW